MRLALTAAALLVGSGLPGGCSPFRDEGSNGDIADWPPPAEVVARGRSMYQARCASCHGQGGEGEAGWTAQNADGT